MNLVTLPITAEFILKRTNLTWREVLFGMDNDWLAPGAPVEIAVKQVISETSPSAEIIELAGARHDDPTRNHVTQLAAMEPAQDASRIRGKWLFLVLAWLFENRERYQDPLQLVEQVYADFGHPPEMRGFVGYEPEEQAEGPAAKGDTGEAGMYGRWAEYLRSQAATYGTKIS
jgi:hypothetical protein